MGSTLVFQTLSRLRRSADFFAAAWPITRWAKVAGPGLDFLEQDSSGNFRGLVFEPGQDLTLATQLDLPAQIGGVLISGEPLEATLGSLYPAQITWEKEPVFAEDGPPVASGPALFTVMPALREGNNGEYGIKRGSTQGSKLFVTTTTVETPGDPQWTVYSSGFAMSMIFANNFCQSGTSTSLPAVRNNVCELVP